MGRHYLYCGNSAPITIDPFGLRANWHHLFPKQFEDKFAAVGIDINDAKYGIILEDTDHIGRGGIHPSWNRDWEEFFKKTPNATKSQILDQLTKMKQSAQYSSILKSGSKTNFGYHKWRTVAKIAGRTTERSAKQGFKKGVKKVVKRVPMLGLLFVYSDIKEKGLINGLCNNALDACPIVGWGKFASECIWGDWFPNKEEYIHE